ncbi:hypothetical protein ACOSP7_005852 [Xanthoceras sorbifolium]|uniref:Uncharacterized protein n=1 Tax=Xanthoceras sorbifolium TaxID=99658 RepID=A0ABQ8IDW5_9ROSI|nr:hypothetical protein JRO89_XS02G0014800 [Xanthoceras sorbifolium]
MISSKRLTEIARMWGKWAAMKRQRISFTRNGDGQNLSSSVANKGHFVVYTADKARFTIPLKYLSRSVFEELLRMSKEEFGIPTNGPITLPCDSTFLKYILSLVRGGISEDLEKSLLTSLATCHFSVTSLDQGLSHHQQTLICSH